MAGAVYIKGVAVTKYKRSAVKDTDGWPSKYSKVFVQPSAVSLISELGPDALLEPMPVDVLFASLSKKKTSIKALLLDQNLPCFLTCLKSFISGIGNWVADEVLYQARIHPEHSSSTLSKESVGALHKSIKEVIEKSLEVGPDSDQFPSNWIYHSREKKPGKALVDGKKIEFITVGGRTSAYVPELQKLPGNQVAKAGSKRANKSVEHGDGVDDVDHESDKEVKATAKSNKGTKPGGQAKKSSAKRKYKESDGADDDSDVDEDDNDDDAGEDRKNKAKKRTSIKKVQTGRNSKAKKAK